MDESRLAPEPALALFRIAQEALTNAIRHSRAQRVSISLDQADEKITLAIRDDGLGIHPQSREKTDQRPRLGLLGIEERTALLGGVFSLRSTPGAGTLVSVQVPFKSS